MNERSGKFGKWGATAMAMYMDGETPARIAEFLPVAPRTVANWKSLF